MNDSDLINEVIQGNDKAFETLMNKYLVSIYNYLRYHINNDEDVKDVIQDVMLSVYNGIKNYQGNSSFKTWVLSITRKKVADFYRLKYAQNTVPLSDNDNYIDSQFTHNTSRLSIYAIIEKLPQLDRDLIHLAFIQEQSYKEIAEILDIPIGTVKSKIHYIKEKLKPLLLEDWRSLYE